MPPAWRCRLTTTPAAVNKHTTCSNQSHCARSGWKLPFAVSSIRSSLITGLLPTLRPSPLALHLTALSRMTPLQTHQRRQQQQQRRPQGVGPRAIIR
jgi:hypothetical protein